jgi:TolA-binding protein
MPFPWITILRLVLPRLPDVISSVRNMKKPQHPQDGSAQPGDLSGRIERLDKALELQSQINEQLTSQLQQLQKRLQFAMAVSIFSAIIAVGTLAVVIWS